MQALLVHVYGFYDADLEIDGIEGPRTRAALGAIWKPGLSWESLLEESAKKAWSGK